MHLKAHSEDFLKIKLKETVLANYIPNTIWTLVEVNTTVTLPFARFQYYFPSYTSYVASYNIKLKRRPLYFMMSSVFPSLVLNLITVLSFALPFASQIALGKHFYLNKLVTTKTFSQVYAFLTSCKIDQHGFSKLINNKKTFTTDFFLDRLFIQKE
jgi:hypothetical protein